MNAAAQQGGASASPAIVPVFWLSDLAGQGGWWSAMADGRVGIGFSRCNCTDAQMTEARRMIDALSPDEREAVEQHIRDTAAKGGR